MTSHELARLLLQLPDLTVSLQVNGHSYHSIHHRSSHGQLQIATKVADYKGNLTITIGDMLMYGQEHGRPFTLLHPATLPLEGEV